MLLVVSFEVPHVVQLLYHSLEVVDRSVVFSNQPLRSLAIQVELQNLPIASERVDCLVARNPKHGKLILQILVVARVARRFGSR